MASVTHTFVSAIADDATAAAAGEVLPSHWNAAHTVSVSKTDVGLSAVTNDAQTKAAIVPNTAPSAGQVLAGNAGGTAYAPVSVSGDATVASTGALTLATSGVTAGTYNAGVLTVDAKGRITAAVSGQIPVNSQSAAYALVLADAGGIIYHPAADTTARTWTIPANASVAFPIGTAITFDNDFGAGALTIAITTDTLVLVGAAGTTGSRTIAAGGQATAVKVTSTRWRISGTGLT